MSPKSVLAILNTTFAPNCFIGIILIIQIERRNQEVSLSLIITSAYIPHL